MAPECAHCHPLADFMEFINGGVTGGMAGGEEEGEEDAHGVPAPVLDLMHALGGWGWGCVGVGGSFRWGLGGLGGYFWGINPLQAAPQRRSGR